MNSDLDAYFLGVTNNIVTPLTNSDISTPFMFVKSLFLYRILVAISTSLDGNQGMVGFNQDSEKNNSNIRKISATSPALALKN